MRGIEGGNGCWVPPPGVVGAGPVGDCCVINMSLLYAMGCAEGTADVDVVVFAAAGVARLRK